MRTKEQTDSVLLWIMNNEIIQITYCGETYRDCDYSEVFTQLSCAGTTAEFRIKPKPQAVHVTITEITHTYSPQYEKSKFTVIDLKSSLKLSDVFNNDERVVILKESCYNKLLGNPALTNFN
jgi:hypothetical protein